MRIASTQYHTLMNDVLQMDSVAAQNLMQQMATGKKLMSPSDDPVTSVRLSRLTREEALLEQYRSNIAALKSRLQQNETSLDSMNQDMLQARDLLVWALNGSNTSEDLNAMASSLTALRDSLFFSTNAKDQEGHYLFSGTLTNTMPIALDTAAAAGARYTFQGNSEIQRVVIGNGVTQPSNVTLPDMASFLNQLDLAIGELTAAGVDINAAATRGVVTGALVGLDTMMGLVSTKIANIGGEQNLLSTMDDNHANVGLSNKQALLDLGQLDYADAAVKLNGYTIALEATHKAYAKVSALSIFDVL